MFFDFENSTMRSIIHIFSLVPNSSVFTVIVCAVILGQVASMTPDYAKAKKAADRVFYLLDKIPPIDSYSDAGLQPVRKMYLSQNVFPSSRLGNYNCIRMANSPRIIPN